MTTLRRGGMDVLKAPGAASSGASNFFSTWVSKKKGVHATSSVGEVPSMSEGPEGSPGFWVCAPAACGSNALRPTT